MRPILPYRGLLQVEQKQMKQGGFVGLPELSKPHSACVGRGCTWTYNRACCAARSPSCQRLEQRVETIRAPQGLLAGQAPCLAQADKEMALTWETLTHYTHDKKPTGAG
jgi:hypothetical protein